MSTVPGATPRPSPTRTPSAEPGPPLDHKAARDIRTLALFARVYCRARHAGRPCRPVPARGAVGLYLASLGAELCDECTRTLLHGAAKRVLCPYDPKPRCKHCPTPCYAPGHREKVREIMRFSGRRLVLRGRLDLLCKYLF